MPCVIAKSRNLEKNVPIFFRLCTENPCIPKELLMMIPRQFSSSLLEKFRMGVKLCKTFHVKQVGGGR
jgi:hypothetical protein